MIGPHEGKELQLMLAGQKPFAVFHDIPPVNGIISEEIIPENAFFPYVQQGLIQRFSKDIQHKKSGDIIRYVCFCLPGEEWRAHFFLWLNESFLSGNIAYNPAHDEIIGLLLGYSAEDIADFFKKQKS